MTTASNEYVVQTHFESYPEGSWWVFSIPVLGAAGQVTNLADVKNEALAIIEAWEDGANEGEEVYVTVHIDGQAEAKRIWEQAEEEEREARAALARAKSRRQQAIALLREEKNYSAEITANVLGISRQRVYQLTR